MMNIVGPRASLRLPLKTNKIQNNSLKYNKMDNQKFRKLTFLVHHQNQMKKEHGFQNI